MTGSLQLIGLRALLIDAVVPIPTARFMELPPNNRRLACTECGQIGYGEVVVTGATAAPWQVPHLFPHRYGCTCGARFLSPGAVTSHLRAMRVRAEGGHGWDDDALG